MYEPLSKSEYSVLRKELTQVIISYLFILILVIAIGGVGYLGIRNTTDYHENQALILSIYVFVVSISYIIALLIAIRPNYTDLKKGNKRVIITMITKKETNEKYGFTANPIVDSNTQSKLVEYRVEAGNQIYFIDKSMFQTIEVGDSIKLHLSAYTNKLINITKSE